MDLPFFFIPEIKPPELKPMGILYASKMVCNPMLIPSSHCIITIEQTEEYEQQDAVRKLLHKLPKRLRKKRDTTNPRGRT